MNDLNNIKKQAMVVDIETSAFYSNGKEINIMSDFDTYLANAICKWVGIFSYKYNKEYYLNLFQDRQKILSLFEDHNIFVSFNGDEFDYPILKNNGLVDREKYYLQVDCMQIMGANTFKNKKGFAYKNRGELMNYKFKNNKLKTMAEEMKLDFQKGDIDYKIFQKNSWDKDEISQIITYLKNDTMATKQIFDKLWTYWSPFTELLDYKSIKNLSWIRSSIASLTYKSACHTMGVEPTYGEHRGKKEEGGGYVLEPVMEEKNNVFYVDWSSLYPHIFCQFNLFSETTEKNGRNIWHGNDLFQVRGYYNIKEQHILAKAVQERLKERIELKKNDPSSPMVYTLKIWLNCFSDDTEVLMANNQIKKIQDCKIGEWVYTINPKTFFVEKKKIIKTYSYDYNGEIHHYKGHHFDFKVTPNHRFLLHHKNKLNKSDFIESKDIQSQHKLPIHFVKKKKYKKIINILNYLNKEDFLYSVKVKNIHGRSWLHRYGLQNIGKKYNQTNRNFIFCYEKIKNKLNTILNNKYTDCFLLDKKHRYSHKIPVFYDNDALSYLIGIYLAEGCLFITKPKKYSNGNVRGTTFSVNIGQYKKVNPVIYKKIINSLNKCNLKYSAGDTNIKISSAVFYKFILENFGKLGYKHFHNKNMFNILNIKKVFEGLIDGDGTKAHPLFTTKYTCLRDDFIELCMRLGYTFAFKNDGCWRIIYSKKRNSFRKTSRTIEQYNKKVHCFEVEDNNTLLAGRNGKFHWTGNSLYGCVRSSIFERVHTENAGFDCCYLGQQINKLAKDMFEEFGFETIYQDTDSSFIYHIDNNKNNKKYLQECLEKIIAKIAHNVPFPSETFSLEIEKFLTYIMFPFSDQPIIDEETGKNVKKGNRLVKERKGKKKNYVYIYEKDGKREVKLVGLPIKKDNATQLGIKIYKEFLEPRIIEENRAKFPKKMIDDKIEEYLKKKEIMELLSREFKIKPYNSYKIPKGKIEPSSIYAQISKGYFNKGDGIINLIKNKKIGKAGKGMKYCTIEEAVEAKLTVDDFDLEKVHNELNAFVKFENNLTNQ